MSSKHERHVPASPTPPPPQSLMPPPPWPPHLQFPQQYYQQQEEFVFKHPFTMIVSGPTSCGKTHFLKDMLQQNEKVCSPAPERIAWLYKRWQPLYGEIQRTVFPRVEFMRGIPIDLESDSFFDPRTRNMIVLDDLMSTSAKDPRINDLFTEGSHHRNLSVVVLNQNLYFSRDPTQRRNCHYLVLFNNPVDRQLIMTLGRQMYPSRAGFLLRKFEEATNKPFGYLVVDLKTTTPDSSRLRTDVLQTGRGMDSAAADEEMDQSEEIFPSHRKIPWMNAKIS